MRKLLLALLALALIPSSAFAWGCDGHQIIAMIARAHLTPAVSAEVDKILTADPISAAHNKFCQDTPTDLMAVAAPWADDVKSSTKTFLWHQIDIPITVRSGDYHKWCDPIGPSVNGKDRPGCVINAMEYELNILRDAAQPAAERATALRMIIHFMGDLTQPLHVSDNHDEGGNCTWFRLPFLEKPTNLHAIWDYELITHELQTRKLSETELAALLDDEFSDQGKQWLAGGGNHIEGFAWEAHARGITFVYSLLDPALPMAAPDAGLANKASCDADKKLGQERNVELPQNYIDIARNTVHEQVAKAGYRLAALLNETLK